MIDACQLIDAAAATSAAYKLIYATSPVGRQLHPFPQRNARHKRHEDQYLLRTICIHGNQSSGAPVLAGQDLSDDGSAGQIIVGRAAVVRNMTLVR